MKLTVENFSSGFLVDDELIASVTENPSAPGTFLAYVLSHETGEYLGYRTFPDLSEALNSINGIKRNWKFEKSGGCGGGGSCGKKCSTGKCPT